MNLTPYQRSILGLMADGAYIMSMTGFHAGMFWCHTAKRERAPRWETVMKLAAAGLLSAHDRNWKGTTYRIADTGRAALKEQLS